MTNEKALHAIYVRQLRLTLVFVYYLWLFLVPPDWLTPHAENSGILIGKFYVQEMLLDLVAIFFFFLPTMFILNNTYPLKACITYMDPCETVEVKTLLIGHQEILYS